MASLQARDPGSEVGRLAVDELVAVDEHLAEVELLAQVDELLS